MLTSNDDWETITKAVIFIAYVFTLGKSKITFMYLPTIDLESYSYQNWTISNNKIQIIFDLLYSGVDFAVPSKL